ncbi:hypothetical protein ACTHP3_21235, partial [Shouchella rhizosphaerae]|uniref:hypothetical protein n=1 Tax=Shouchella rhizosphaerae TaxID=866786 RepID=UPI003F7E0180
PCISFTLGFCSVFKGLGCRRSLLATQLIYHVSANKVNIFFKKTLKLLFFCGARSNITWIR